MNSVSGRAGHENQARFASTFKVGRDTLLEIRSPVTARPVTPRSPETPELLQAFISRHRSFFALLAILVAQMVLISVQITREHSMPLARRWALTAMSPFERSLRGLADVTGGAWTAARDLGQGERLNRDLSERVAGDETRIRSLNEQAAENGRLRALLDFKTHTTYSTVAAEVIGSSPGDGSNTVLIDKGADAGLVSDLAVMTPDGVAGKIVAVYAHSAQVLLITDSAAGAGAMIEKSRAQGVLRGEGRGTCRLDYIMNEDGVAPGDAVVTSGLDHVFPKGLPLGTVVKVGDGNIYKTVVVKPSAALNRLEEVLVVTSRPAAPEEAQRH